MLNADRDIYQARLAQERLLNGEGRREANIEDFEENAKQVSERFHRYLEYLADEPDVVAPYSHFDKLYEQWLAASRSVVNISQKTVGLNQQLAAGSDDFSEIRTMLDSAGDALRKHTQNLTNANIDDMSQFVEAMASVLNSDRDLYQAQLAIQQLMHHEGDYPKNIDLFEENANQALLRFHSYRSFLVNYPELTAPYERFDTVFNHWYQQSMTLLNSTDAQSYQTIPTQVL